MAFHRLRLVWGEVNKLVAAVRRRRVVLTYKIKLPLWLWCVGLWLVGRSVGDVVCGVGDGKRGCMQEKRG